MRTPKVHAKSSIKFTANAAFWCNILNQHKKQFPQQSFKEIGKIYGLSETNARRYYYGMHHRNCGGDNYSQMRQGACVPVI
jgi:hypothetical protein